MHQGGRLSEMEKLQLQEILRNEQLCVNKCEFFGQQMQDPALRDLCRHMIDMSQRHINELNSILHESGISPQQQ